MLKAALMMAAVLCVVLPARAELVSKMVAYNDGPTALEGYLVYDSAVKGPRPGVLVVHEWWGLNDFAKQRADELAKLGYVAFAADMYGKGIQAKTSKEAAELAGPLRADRKLMRRRATAALDVLKGQELADRSRIGAIGYCFGGTTVLELARGGADIAAVVSFHGNLDTPVPADARNIKAKVLVLSGADDPNAPPLVVDAFSKEMKDGNVDYEIVLYGHAVHSFTNPASGNDPTKGVAYNAHAASRSWQAMKDIFDEAFAPKK